MKVNDIFGRTADGVGSVRYKQEEEAAKRAREAQKPSEGDDKITISSLSKQLSQISTVLREDDRARDKRVSDLKARIESGEYSVSGTEVAKSMVAFARDSEFEGA